MTGQNWSEPVRSAWPETCDPTLPWDGSVKLNKHNLPRSIYLDRMSPTVVRLPLYHDEVRCSSDWLRQRDFGAEVKQLILTYLRGGALILAASISPGPVQYY